MNILFTLLRDIRAPFMRIIMPMKGYFLFPSNIHPLSHKYGFDRGTPIDRYYIDQFLNANKQYIQGVCLEIEDTTYIMRYGGTAVTHADALDINQANKRATIYGDLRHLSAVKDNTYDCIILTQTLTMIDDYDAALQECNRILKPGGALLATVSSLCPMIHVERSYWRFTVASLKYILAKHFKNTEIQPYGNVLSGQAFWVGAASEELSKDKLDYMDPRYPVLIGFRVKK